jgi:myo-inositol-1(or 4)-monophosphatase
VRWLIEKNMCILKSIAREVYSAANPLLGTAESGRTVGLGFGEDETSFIDDIAEKAILNYLIQNKISCIFVGEESGVQKLGEKPSFYLVTDAVDGTTNATRGLRFASTSLAISLTNDLDSIEAAVVMDLFGGGIYEALQGKGAYYNGAKIKTSNTTVLDKAVLSVDVSRAPDSVKKIIPLVKVAKSIRSLGSAALEICQVASGHLDAYVDVRGRLRMFDIAAAMLIVKEAGGVFLQPNSSSFRNYPLVELSRFSVIASANKKIHNRIISHILKI